MNEQQYTVFTRYPGGYEGFLLRWGSLENCAASAAAFKLFGDLATPVAWCTEEPIDSKDRAALYAESLAAGRLIEKTASGWVALGAEKQEEAETLTGRLSLGVAIGGGQADPNAAMIARDGPARSALFLPAIVFGIDFAAVFPPAAAVAKPNPFPTTLRSPDCDSGPSDHLNASRHQMAAKQFDKA